MTRIVTDENLDEFLGFAQQVVDVSYGKVSSGYGSTVSSPTLSFDNITARTKYARIIATTYGDHRTVWGFIRLADGDVLKADGWKAPALNFPRGNIFDKSHGLERAPWTGVS